MSTMDLMPSGASILLGFNYFLPTQKIDSHLFGYQLNHPSCYLLECQRLKSWLMLQSPPSRTD